MGFTRKSNAVLRGFTLAEVLITLAVIGIVAAISLPSLVANYNEKAWETERMAFQARMFQAISQIKNLGGFGEYKAANQDSEGKDTADEAFILEGLSKYYKIPTVCNKDNLTHCGIPNTIITLDSSNSVPIPTNFHELNSALVQESSSAEENTKVTIANTSAVAFITVNGESVLLYYNPYCEDLSENNYNSALCLNMVFDLNGNKGPNQIGKDVGFLTAFGRHETRGAAPLAYKNDAGSSTFENAPSLCTQADNFARMPSRDELMSLYVNKIFIGENAFTNPYWTGEAYTAGTSGYAYALEPDKTSSSIKKKLRGASAYVRCIHK